MESICRSDLKQLSFEYTWTHHFTLNLFSKVAEFSDDAIERELNMHKWAETIAATIGTLLRQIGLLAVLRNNTIFYALRRICILLSGICHTASKTAELLRTIKKNLN